MDEYRYLLTRDLYPRYGLSGGDVGGRLVWVMLNPSTADESLDDNTIRRVVGFTHRAGFDSFAVVNLFARRCTKPVHLIDRPGDPVGPENGDTLRRVIFGATDVVLAWGSWLAGIPPRLRPEPPNVAAMCRAAGVRTWCVGVTSKGHPRHPLYRPNTQPLIPYPLGDPS